MIVSIEKTKSFNFILISKLHTVNRNTKDTSISFKDFIEKKKKKLLTLT